MSNPLFQQYGKQMPNGNMFDLIQRFQQFQKTFNGNPQQMVQQMLNSGQITQEQFNNAVKTANEMIRMMK